MKEKLSLLIAEDDHELRELLVAVAERALGDMFHTNVREAGDGNEAIEILKEGGTDLVVLDLVMPERTGLEVLKWRLTQPHLLEIPIIVLSGDSASLWETAEWEELSIFTFLVEKPATEIGLGQKLRVASNQILQKRLSA